MRPSKLEKTLLAVARATPLSERVPYAFEQRILARIRALPPVDAWAQWAQALSRSALACLALALLMGTLSAFVPKKTPPPSNDLALDFEKTLLAAMDGDYAR